MRILAKTDGAVREGKFPWARYQGHTWRETGHRLVVPAWDAQLATDKDVGVRVCAGSVAYFRVAMAAQGLGRCDTRKLVFARRRGIGSCTGSTKKREEARATYATHEGSPPKPGTEPARSRRLHLAGRRSSRRSAWGKGGPTTVAESVAKKS